MDGLIPIESLAPQPVTKELLALNETTWERGLTLTEEEARELSETRSRALRENDRIEFGSEVMRKILERFSASRYLDQSTWADTLNEITYYFYYIKAETEDKISDTDLVEEMFTRFELYCRGDIDRFEGKEIERIIRKVNMGDRYGTWYGDEDDDPASLGRMTPGNLLDDVYEGENAGPEEYEGGAADEIARDEAVEMDVFGDFEEDEPVSGYENEDDLSLYDEVVDEAVEEDSPDHPLNRQTSAVRDLKERGYFSLNRLTGRGEKRAEQEDPGTEGAGIRLPGGASLSVGDAYPEDFDRFTEDEDAFLASFLSSEADPDIDALDTMIDRIAKSGNEGGDTDE
ncbi:MAG: hypothetical protein E7576_09905 [Ruminococcaceae bacterium]|jgi:hypothetical protein|nr:hypothetical protein [Oscillospiraceae bacterium]